MILSDDRALTLLVGSNLVFSCNASGLPAPTITWLKYGNPTSDFDLFLNFKTIL